MNWKTLLACCALATFPLGCDSDENGDDHGHETEGDTEHHHESEGDDHGHESEGDDHEHTELITTITLTFTPESGETVTASFSDPDGDGGASGTSDPIVLAPNTTYTMTVALLNELEEPAEDVTEEIREEAEEHQFLVYGASVTGPGSAGDGLVTHAYADVESDYGDNAVGDDLPVGIANTITTTDASTMDGELRLMLRHVPELNGSPQKAAGLAEAFAEGGDPPGETDVDVGFVLTVE